MAAAPDASSAKKASRISAVDDDKLWRARIQQELQHQRAWLDEYGFMVSSTSKGVSTTAASLTNQQVEEVKKSMKGVNMQSTVRSSYVQRKPIDVYSDGAHNRKKFRDE